VKAKADTILVFKLMVCANIVLLFGSRQSNDEYDGYHRSSVRQKSIVSFPILQKRQFLY
jgi:hypothetical protein